MRAMRRPRSPRDHRVLADRPRRGARPRPSDRARRRARGHPDRRRADARERGRGHLRPGFARGAVHDAMRPVPQDVRTRLRPGDDRARRPRTGPRRRLRARAGPDAGPEPITCATRWLLEMPILAAAGPSCSRAVRDLPGATATWASVQPRGRLDHRWDALDVAPARPGRLAADQTDGTSRPRRRVDDDSRRAKRRARERGSSMPVPKRRQSHAEHASARLTGRTQPPTYSSARSATSEAAPPGLRELRVLRGSPGDRGQ